MKPPMTMDLRNIIHKPMSYIVILLVITYVLGYFTATFSFYYACSPTDKNNDYNWFGPPRCGTPVPAEQVRTTIFKEFFDGTSPYENFPPPHLANLIQPQKFQGWDSDHKVFENLIKKVRPRTIIEIGTFLGSSAMHMVWLTRQLGLKTQILCVDDFRGWAGFRESMKFIPIHNADPLMLPQFLQNVISTNTSEWIVPVPFSSSSALEKLCEMGVLGDLIEVDAGHDFHSAWSDINRAYKLLSPGGVLFGHDYFLTSDDYGVRRAIDLFARVHGFKVKTDNMHWILDDTVV